MESLIKKLQEEAGLTEEQAIKALSVLKDYMDKENLEIDWQKFFKGKYIEFKEKTKSFYDNYTQHAEEYSNKLADKAEDFAIQARRTARELGNKASEMFKNED